MLLAMPSSFKHCYILILSSYDLLSTIRSLTILDLQIDSVPRNVQSTRTTAPQGRIAHGQAWHTDLVASTFLGAAALIALERQHAFAVFVQTPQLGWCAKLRGTV